MENNIKRLESDEKTAKENLKAERKVFNRAKSKFEKIERKESSAKHATRIAKYELSNAKEISAWAERHQGKELGNLDKEITLNAKKKKNASKGR